MSGQASQMLAKAQKFRDVDGTLQHDKHPNVGEKLADICKFLQEHETPSLSDCTHTVFEKYQDWWMTSKPSFMLAIAEDNTIDLLNRHCGVLFELGIPLTLAEKRTPEIRFVQDVEIWGTKDEAVSAEELLKPDGQFLNLLGATLGEIYPMQDFLDLVAFDSTGLSQVKGVRKTSIRLVWPALVTDKDRAGRIRDYVLHKFKESKDNGIKDLEGRMLGLNSENGWNSVFSDAIYFGRNGIRMPLNDRVSPPPMKKPERRPFSPVGVYRYTYANAALQQVEKIYGANDLQPHEWMKIGSLRRDAGTPLTEWTPPAWKGERAARTQGNSMLPQARDRQCDSSGKVKIRTSSGSDGGRPGGNRKATGPGMIREERLVTVEREFDGTEENFREKLEAQMGKDHGTFEQEDDGLIWKQPQEGGARIKFKKENKRVYVIGKPHQIRSLINVIAPFAREVGESTKSMMTSVRSAASNRSGGGSSRGGSQVHAPPAGAGYAPSNAYAPSAVYAPSAAAYAASTASNIGGSGAGVSAQNSQRVVIRTFDPQSNGELKLAEGDRVTMTHDPEEGQHNVHRWVYGTNDTSGERGWFPFSHTQPMEETVDAASA